MDLNPFECIIYFSIWHKYKDQQTLLNTLYCMAYITIQEICSWFHVIALALADKISQNFCGITKSIEREVINTTT